MSRRSDRLSMMDESEIRLIAACNPYVTTRKSKRRKAIQSPVTSGRNKPRQVRCCEYLEPP